MVAERDMEILVDNKLYMNQQCRAATTKANQILGCIHRSITSRDRDEIMSLYSVLVKLHLEYCAQFWSPQFKKGTNRLDRVWRAIKRPKGWRTSAVRKDRKS